MSGAAVVNKSEEVPQLGEEKIEEPDENIEGLLEKLRGFPNYEQLRTRILTLDKKKQIVAINYALKKQKEKMVQAPAESEELPVVELVSQKNIVMQTLLNSVRMGEVSVVKSILNKPENKYLVNTPVALEGDDIGHPLLHWAALDGQQLSVGALLSFGADSMAQNSRGETALHWASLKGHRRIVHMILDASEDAIAIVDGQGYSAIHHAAQYGQKEIIAQLLSYGRLKLDTRDNCGRTALHWSVYNQKYYTTEYLLNKGSDPMSQDWEDMTPLHWAASKGDQGSATIILRSIVADKEAGRRGFKIPFCSRPLPATAEKVRSVLNVVDKKGFTAQELSEEKILSSSKLEGRRHKGVARLLKEASKRGTVDRGLVHDEKHWSWYAWPIFGPLAIAYYFRYLSPSNGMAEHPLLFLITISSAALMWVCWFYLQKTDPGYLKRPGTKKLSAKGAYLRELYAEVLSNGLEVPICTTCEIVKPLRSKHDRVSDCCIERFDHFCPWVGHPIASGNYFMFVGLLFTTGVAIFGFILAACYSTLAVSEGAKTSALQKLISLPILVYFLAFFIFYDVALLMQHVMLIARNLTTNEFVNMRKYKYLKSGQNHFSQGVVKNVLEFFGAVEEKKVNLRKYYAHEFAKGSQQEERIRLIRATQVKDELDVGSSGNWSITQNGATYSPDSFALPVGMA